MDDNDSFQDRLREIADQFSRSVDKLSEVDVEKLAEQYGVDVQRARMFADAAGQWLSGRIVGAEPMFGPDAPDEPGAREPEPSVTFHDDRNADPAVPAADRSGPHPLDHPSGAQGLLLSALDSGRWTVRPGSNQLADSGEGPPPPGAAPDLIGELRARDWITADGSLTLVGRHALTRWFRTADGPVAPSDV